MSEPTRQRRREVWYVMRHLSPELIDQQLQQVNEQRMRDNKHSFAYIIPYQYIRKAAHDDSQGMAFNRDVDKNNSLRNDFRFFVFIKATEEEINQLVQEDWNKNGRLHLYFCRSRSGNPLRAKESEMSLLIRLFVSQREKFNFVPIEKSDFRLGEKIRLKSGILKEHQFSVTKIRYTDEGINLTLGLPIFDGAFSLQVEDYPVSEVNAPTRLQRFFSKDFVQVMEQELIAILRHRVKGSPSSPQKGGESDAEKLNTYHFLNYMEFADTTEHHHIQTLLLLCASLRKDQHTVEALAPTIVQLLNPTTEPATDEEAFMAAVLFVATHNIAYRTAAKHYEQTHDTLSAPLSLLMPIIKDIRIRKNRETTNQGQDSASLS